MNLWPLITGQGLLCMALAVGKTATQFKVYLVLGSDRIIHTYNHNSPANKDQNAENEPE